MGRRGSSGERMEVEGGGGGGGGGSERKGRRKSEAQMANETPRKGQVGDGSKTPRNKGRRDEEGGGHREDGMHTPAAGSSKKSDAKSRRKSKEGGGEKADAGLLTDVAIPKDDTEPACLVYSQDGKLLLAGVIVDHLTPPSQSLTTAFSTYPKPTTHQCQRVRRRGGGRKY
jgi:hypothetical protein